jgi:hypothetical protein
VSSLIRACELLYTGEDTASRVRRLFSHINAADLALESIATPLLGHRASSFSLVVNLGAGWAPQTLTRIALNVTHFHLEWLTSMSNLGFIELAVSMPGHYTSSYFHRTDRWLWEPPSSARVPDFEGGMLKVQEFRLMADNQYSFAEDDVLVALTLFPDLRKLRFGAYAAGGSMEVFWIFDL